MTQTRLLRCQSMVAGNLSAQGTGEQQGLAEATFGQALAVQGQGHQHIALLHRLHDGRLRCHALGQGSSPARLSAKLEGVDAALPWPLVGEGSVHGVQAIERFCLAVAAEWRCIFGCIRHIKCEGGSAMHRRFGRSQGALLAGELAFQPVLRQPDGTTRAAQHRACLRCNAFGADQLTRPAVAHGAACRQMQAAGETLQPALAMRGAQAGVT